MRRIQARLSSTEVSLKQRLGTSLHKDLAESVRAGDFHHVDAVVVQRLKGQTDVKLFGRFMGVSIDEDRDGERF